jgi:hypothetical protein
MALTAKQRNALPRSAFLDPVRRRFPVPTAAQARRAGIPEAQRLRTLRNALARAAQPQKRGAKRVTPAATRRKVALRARGKVASVRQHPAARHRRAAAARRHRARRRR